MGGMRCPDQALVVPGRAYSPAMPLLELTRRVLVQHGVDVRQIWWEDPVPTEAFVREQVDAAVGDDPGPVLVVGKSLGTRASADVAERGWPAIWLTPLLRDEACVAGVRANPARQLLVGGLIDDLWDAEVAADLAAHGCDVHEIAGADHALEVPGDAARSADVLLEVARVTETFLTSLAVAR